MLFTINYMASFVDDDVEAYNKTQRGIVQDPTGMWRSYMSPVTQVLHTLTDLLLVSRKIYASLWPSDRFLF